MKLIETRVIGDRLRLRFADSPDPARATEWIDIQVSHPEPELETCLADIRRAALDRAQDVLK